MLRTLTTHVPITINTTVGAATKAQFANPVTNQAAGVVFSVTVNLVDANGNIAINDNSSTITVSIGTNPTGAILNGTLSKTAVAGQAVFGDLTITVPGNSYTLIPASGSLVSVPSGPFDVGPGPAAKLTFGTQPSNSIAGSNLTVTVRILDAFNNLTTSTATVTMAIGTNPTGAALNGTTSVAAVAGVASFGNLNITVAGTGYTLAASASLLTGTTSNSFNITTAAPSMLVVGSGTLTQYTAGATISPSLTVQIQDAFGNLVSSTASIAISLTQNPTGATLNGTLNHNAVAGTATFNDLSVNIATPNAQQSNGYIITATSSGLTPVSFNPFLIVPDIADQLVWNVQPSDTLVNNPITPAMSVKICDQFGNLETTDNATIISLSIDSGAGNLNGTTDVTVTNGVANFPGVSVDAVQTGMTLLAFDNLPGTTSIDSVPFNITSSPSPPAQFITTPFDNIPNFGFTPTVSSAGTGLWSNPATWSTNAVPTTGDVVNILSGHTVTYDVNSSAVINTVSVLDGGTLTWLTSSTTRLVVLNLLVLEGGTLNVGTTGVPIASNVTATVEFADVAINTTTDPEQYGNSLIVLGTLKVCGATKTPYVRLSVEPLAGVSAMTAASAPSGWLASDKLLLPDTRALVNGTQTGSNYVPQWEEPVLASISGGTTLNINSPLSFTHFGARDVNGVLDSTPHTANRTRNVIFKSANPSGTRGYCFFTYRANIDVRYAAFEDLGRQTNAPEDNTTFDSGGNVTHVGTNQGDRNPITLMHLFGPVVAPANGYQHTFIGNAVSSYLSSCNFVWPFYIEDTHYGLIQQNVIYNYDGAGISYPQGGEFHNRVDANFVMRITGNGQRFALGLEGSAYWFRGPLNYATNNIACNIGAASGPYCYGFLHDFTFLGTITIPNFQGADMSVPANTSQVNGNASALPQFEGNEVYGATWSGYTFWWIGAVDSTPGAAFTSTPLTTIKNFKVWNQTWLGIFIYPMYNVTIDGMVTRGNFNAIVPGSIAILSGDYQIDKLIIKNCDIQGNDIGYEGLVATEAPNGVVPVEMDDCFWSNNSDVVLIVFQSSSAYAALKSTSSWINMNRCRHTAPPGKPLQAIWMQYAYPALFSYAVFSVTNYYTVYVTDFQNVAGDSFQVFFSQQDPNYILEQTQISSYGGWPRVLASPESGKTNTYNYNTYGLAVGGQLAPAGATTRTGIIGGYLGSAPIPALVAPIPAQAYHLLPYIRYSFYTSYAAGSTFSIQVSIHDRDGSLVTGSTAPVTVRVVSNTTGGVLSGTTTVNAVAGVATFGNLSFNLAGYYALSYSSPGMASAIGQVQIV